MADFVFKISPNIILGSYSASRIGQFVQEWGTKFMVLLDPILHESGISAKIKQSLTDRNVDFFIFDEIPNAPDSKVVSQALKLAKEKLCQAKDGVKIVPLDVLAIDVKDGWDALGAISGRTATEEIIDRIYSKFCLGK